MSRTEPDELVAIGQIVKPFGVHGEVRVRSLSDVAGRFEGLRRVTVVSKTGKDLVTEVQRVREDGASYVVRFHAFTTPEEAAEYRGALVKIPRSQSPVLPEGQYYESDLIGLVVRTEQGSGLGVLEEIVETGGGHIFIVRNEGAEVLIPAIKSVVTELDVTKRTMIVRPIEGLLPE